MAEKKQNTGDFGRLSQVTDMKMLKMMMLNRKSQMKMILKSRFAAEDEDDLMEK